MGHAITAILLKNDFDNELAKKFDLAPVQMKFGLTMFFVNSYYSEYWQLKLGTKGRLVTNCPRISYFPSEIVLSKIMQTITKNDNPHFAIILTEYHGGMGGQNANVYKGDVNQDLNAISTNQVLNKLGVIKEKGFDEFDTINLGNYRSNPDYLDKYSDINLS